MTPMKWATDFDGSSRCKTTGKESARTIEITGQRKVGWFTIGRIKSFSGRSTKIN